MIQVVAEKSCNNKKRHSLFIPRASVNVSSSSGTSIKCSNSLRQSQSITIQNENFILRRSISEDISKLDIDSKKKNGITPKNNEAIFVKKIFYNHEKNLQTHHNENHQVHFLHKIPKAGPMTTQSSSSSSSSDSNQSNYSVNSLLLSVKNLENFNKSNEGAIHKHHYHHHKSNKKAASVHEITDYNSNLILKSNYYFNNFLNQGEKQLPLYEHRWKMLQNISSISKIDDKNFMQLKKEIEADQLSTVSSTTTTNFTVISLNDLDERLYKSKKAICRRSHTISILIFVMTTIFVIFISTILILMDMRNQKMPS